MIRWLSRKFAELDELAKIYVVAGILLACGVALYAAFSRDPDTQYIVQFEDARDEGGASGTSPCLTAARTRREVTWATECESLARQLVSRRSDCLSDKAIMSNPYMGKSYCDKAFGVTDPSPRCALPALRGQSINQAYDEEQRKCLAEAGKARSE